MQDVTQIVTRFAPSPTGRLHLGTAYAAVVAHDMARAAGGRFLLRIEDIDAERCRPEFEQSIYEDLTWLGLTWDGPVRRQSEHLAHYRTALKELTDADLTYACFCTRNEIAAEIAAMPSAPHGPEGPIYPGTCRTLTAKQQQAELVNGKQAATRLDIAKASPLLNTTELSFHEAGRGPADEHGEITVDPNLFGDIVLGRKGIGVSYHLAVTLDDHLQGVTHVTRGQDLFHASHIQRVLQTLLKLDEPVYHHHGLITDKSGRRLAKRDKDQTLKALRESGVTPDEIRAKFATLFP